MASLLLGVRVGLAAVFATAGFAKLFDQPGARRSLGEFGAPGPLVFIGALLLPLAELATAAALVAKPSARLGAIAALVLLAGFIAGIANAMAKGRAPDCHCFGQLHSEPAGGSTIARNLVLAAFATLVVVEGPGPAVHTWIADRTAAELVAVGLGLAALALAAVAARLWLDRRRLRAELFEAQNELSILPNGLPVGFYAPEFTATDASGAERTRKELVDRGQPLILVFTSEGCESCALLQPEIDRWQSLLSDRLTVATVEDIEILQAFRIKLTPTAVQVAPDGRISAPPAEGIAAIEPLVRLALRHAA